MTRLYIRKRSREHCTYLPLHQMHVTDLGGISAGCCGGAGVPTFAKDDRIGGCPSLMTGEKTEAIMRQTPHNKQPIHGVNTRRHKPGMFVDIFKIVLFSSVPRQCLSLHFSILLLSDVVAHSQSRTPCTQRNQWRRQQHRLTT